MNLDSYLKEELEAFLFMDVTPKWLPSEEEVSFPIPMKVDDMAVEDGADAIHLLTEDIFDRMLFVMGADLEFPYNETYLKIISKHFPNVTAYLQTRVAEAVGKQAFKEAMVFSRTHINFFSTNAKVFSNYAKACSGCIDLIEDSQLRKELYETARRMYQMALDLDPTDWENSYHLAYFARNDGDQERALDLFRLSSIHAQEEVQEEIRQIILQLEEESCIASGFYLIDEGRFEEAIALLSKVQPELLFHRYRQEFALGIAYGATEQYKKAIAHLEAALLIDNGDDYLLSELGLNYAALKEEEQALEFYEDAIRINPYQVEHYCNASLLYMRLGNLIEAKKLLKEAEEIDTLNPFIEICYQQLRLLEQENEYVL